MKKILFVSAPILAIVSQNAFAEETKNFSFYGTAYATQGLYNSSAGKFRNGLTLGIDEFRPGVRAKYGVVTGDVQFEFKDLFAGEGGTDWDRASAPIKLDPQTNLDATKKAQYPTLDNMYKSAWNSKLRKATAEYKLGIGTLIQAGLVRPDGAAGNSFYQASGPEGYDNGVGATLSQPIEHGAVKATLSLSILNKIHVNSAYIAANANYDCTPSDKALHFAAKATIAENTEIIAAYAGNYNAATEAGVNHIEASASHKMGSVNASLWYESNAYHIDSKNKGNKMKVGLDAGYTLNDNVKGIASYAYLAGADTANDTEIKDKVQHEFLIGPKFSKDSASAELALGITQNESDKAFKDRDGKDTNMLTKIWATVGYEL